MGKVLIFSGLKRVFPFWASALVLGFLLRPKWAAPTLIEFFCHLLVLSVLLAVPATNRFFSAMPKPHRAVFFLFFTLLLAGQFVNDLRLTYPFTAWAMYSRPQPLETIDYLRLRGTRPSGESFLLEPERFVPSNDKATVVSRIKKTTDEYTRQKEAAKRLAAGRKLEQLLRAIGKIYAETHPAEPIEKIELSSYAWSYRQQKQADAVQTPVLVVELKEKALP